MIIGGKSFFSSSFYSSFFNAKSWGPYLNSSTHVYLEDFLFMVCHCLFKTWTCQKIPAARGTRGGMCFAGEGQFLQYSAVKYVYCPYSQGVSAQSLRVSLENTFSYSAKLPVVGFTVLSSVFRTVFISIGHSIES